jgi:hypothetical protein
MRVREMGRGRRGVRERGMGLSAGERGCERESKRVNEERGRSREIDLL